MVRSTSDRADESDEEFEDDEPSIWDHEDEDEDEPSDSSEDEADDWDDPEEDPEDEDEEEDDWEEDWEDEDGDFAPPEITRTLSFGLVAMAPLFLLYELGVAAFAGAGESRRSAAEALLAIPLQPFTSEDSLALIRRSLVVFALFVALAISARREWPIVGRLVRVPVEGAIGALLLGPLLGLIARQAEPLVGDVGALGAGQAAPFQEIALAMGGAAFEELVFRIGLLSLIYVVISRGMVRFGWPEGFARIVAAATGGILSAAAFSAFHLAPVAQWLGGPSAAGGEAFHLAVFTWRTIAGILLAAIVVWRGVGVAAWSHALFNLALMLRF